MGLTSEEEDELKCLQLEELRMRAHDRRQKTKRAGEWQNRKGKAIHSITMFADRVGLRYRAYILLLGLGFFGVFAGSHHLGRGIGNEYLESHDAIAVIWVIVMLTTGCIGVVFVYTALFKADLKKRVKS
jgi:hypothetical protein